MRAESDSNTVLSEALRTLQDYVGLKLHFTGDMVFKRSMQLKLSESTLMKRKDAFMFFEFADKTPDREDRIQLMVSGFKMNPSLWIGEIYDHELKDFHKQRMRVVGALTYSFRTDVDRIVRYMEESSTDVRKLLRTDGMAPHIISNMDLIDGGVSDETLSLIDKGFKFTKQPSDDPLWNDRKLMISKYHHWLDVDGDFLKQQLSRLVGAQAIPPNAN